VIAYLDGATGGMIVAALAGGLAGVAVLFRFFGHKILGVFSPKHRAAARAAKEELVPADEER
jgi:hypothetical protein